jgi:hypothetical protein
MTDGRARLRFALGTLAVAAAAWSVLLIVTGGISFDIGALHVSSRNVRNPAIGAVLALIVAAWLAPAGARRRTIAADVSSILRGPALVVSTLPGVLRRTIALILRPQLLTALAVCVVAVTLAWSWTRGAFVVGGSDSYGYVSEAHLFATGRLRMDVPLGGAFPHVPLRAFSPLGYRPADDGTNTLVPTYAPGLPLTMAAAELVGGMNAVYVVMPLLAALAVWSAYCIGAHLVGPGVGLGAAVLVVASPAFTFQLIGPPLSDVCAAGWWALSVSLLFRDRRWATLASGGAAGMAILTRPNLLLVVIMLGLYLLWPAIRDAARRRDRVARLTLFSIPVVVGCLTVAAFNTGWYGSPFRSGYAASLFSASYWDENVIQFTAWLIDTQTPLFFIGFAAPLIAGWLPRRPGIEPRAATLLLTGVAVSVFASYLFYMPYEAWWFLRFLLPAYPALAVLTCATLAGLSARFGSAVGILGVALVLGAAAVSLSMGKDLEVLGENRYRIIGEWVRDRLPQNAIVLALQHGGNVKHYSGREVVRYDYVREGDFEAAIDEMLAAGYHPYLVIDEWEVPVVRQMHDTGPRGALNGSPIAILPLGNVTVWDLAEDPAAARDGGRSPELIPIPEFIRRQLP